MHLPDSRRQQAVIGLVAVSRVASAVLLGTAMAVYIGRQASPFAVSMALTVFYLGLVFFAPIWGAIADITGRRRLVLLVTGALATAALLPLALVQTVPVQIGVRGVYAAFAAGFGAVMLSIVSERGGEEGRGRSIGFYNSAVAVGGIGGRLLVGFLLGFVLPADMYLLVAAVSALSVLGVLFLEDPTPTPEAEVTPREVVAEIRRRLLPAVDEREHLRTNGLGWLYLGIVLRNMTQKGLGSVIPVFLLGSVGVNEFTMGAILAISPAVRTVAMYVLGTVADAVGRKPLIVAGLTGAGLQAVVLAGAPLPGDQVLRIAVASASYVIHAVTFSALTTGAIAFIGDVAPPDRESELMGLRTTTRGIGGVLGPVLVGAIATVAGYSTAFVAASVLAFAGAAVVGVNLVESRPDADASLREALAVRGD
ncbi:MAG: MFS transporter [Halobacteriales archaeon]